MDTESRYLRDIRDAIKGIAKRSGMDVSGNAKTKYLKEIADAIRENGGGGKDGNDKVKQEYASGTLQEGDLDVLVAYETGHQGITGFIKKARGLVFNSNTKKLKITDTSGTTTSGTNTSNEITNDECTIKTHYVNNEHPGYGRDVTKSIKFSTKYNTGDSFITIRNTVEQESSGTTTTTGMDINEDDIRLTGDSWDGTNASLKSALAAAKEGSFFIANIYDTDPDDELFGVEKETETINITSITSSSSVVVPMYADKTYDEIKTAMESGLIPLLKDAHRIYSVYGYDFVRGSVIFKDLLSGNTYIQNEEVKTDSNYITFHEST